MGAPSRSQLQQFSRSTLQQRGAAFNDPWSEIIELMEFRITTHSVASFADPGPLGLEIAATPWSIMRPIGFPDFHFKQSGANYLRTYPDGGARIDSWNDGNAGAAALGLVQDAFRMYGKDWNTLTSNGQLVFQAQTPGHITFWGWGTQGTGSVLYWQRARYMYTKASQGFVFKADLWVRKRDDPTQFGWSLVSHDYPTFANPFDLWTQGFRISLENCTLFQGMTQTPAYTWREVPWDFPAMQNPSFQAGFLGRAIIAVDFETPSAFRARTGIQVPG